MRRPALTLLALVAVARGLAASTAQDVSSERFEETRTLRGIRFHVSCDNVGASPHLLLEPSGLEIDNAPITSEVEGRVVGAEVGDLDSDGSPEICVYVQGEGAGAGQSLVAWAANRRKPLSQIYLPPVTDTPAASLGYRGRDELAVVENNLLRRFPVYREGDADDAPTGGMRQPQYELAPGEAGWILKVDRVVEY